MDMSDEKNADLVKEYRLSGAPAPLVLLFSNTGVLLGGMVEAQITKEALADAYLTVNSRAINQLVSFVNPPKKRWLEKLKS